MTSKSKRERSQSEMANTTLQMMIEFYVGDMKLKNRTQDSIRTNQDNLRRFSSFVEGQQGGAPSMADLSSDVARAYVHHLQSRTRMFEDHPYRKPVDKPLSPFTIQKTVRILRGFGTWLTRDGFPNPFDELELPTVPKQIVEVLTQDEIDRVLGSINPDTVNGSRNYAMIWMMLDCGPRISEVAGLKLADLDLGNRIVKVFGKGRKERMVPFGQKTARLLLRYVQVFRPRPANPGVENVFLSLDGYPMTRGAMEGIVRRIRAASGVGKLHAHLLRHTFSVNFLATGGGLETLRRILGHESLEVTKRYLSGLSAEQVRSMYADFSPMDRLEVTERRGGRRSRP